MNVKKIIYKAIRCLGISYLFKYIKQRNSVTIILMHDISKEQAEQSFIFLKENYNVISLDTYLYNRKKNIKNPPYSLIITFDDGHIGNYKLLPIIKEIDIPITIFLCAGIVDSNKHFWFKETKNRIQRDNLKRISNQERLLSLESLGFCNNKEYEYPQALNKKQIDEMIPYVNFQSHTLYHPCLPNCNDDESKYEIVDSKKILETKFDLSINAFSYPNGDYSEREVDFLKKAGYECAITVDYGFNDNTTCIFKLKRISVNEAVNMDEFVCRTSGIVGYCKNIIYKCKRCLK